MITLTFMDGVVLMSIIFATVYAIIAWQSKRCFKNVNQFNNSISALAIRQEIMANKMGIELPSMDELCEKVRRPGSPCGQMASDTEKDIFA